MSASYLSAEQRTEFEETGVLIIRGFYDLANEIVPVQQAIYDVIGLIIDKYSLQVERPPFAPASFDAGFQEVIAANRGYGAEIYDAVKQIPAFVRLVGSERHEALFRELRPGSAPAVAGGGYGIRIDNPFEDRFRANWHQEYPAQLRSLDGVVYWSPLVAVTPELGPVKFCAGSHREGPVPVFSPKTGNPEKAGAYSLTLRNEAELLRRYDHSAPLTNPGDLVVIDFLVLHASGENRSNRSRWSMQLRYFNFREATGISHGWKGSYAAGVDFCTVHPELCADQDR